MCGEYVVCVDSDDYVTEDYIEYLYGLVSVNNADIAVCQFKKYIIHRIGWMIIKKR